MGKFFQVLTAVACSMTSFVMGLLNTWPSYTLAMYQDPNSTLLSAPVSEVESSLIGSIPSLGGMVGSAIVGVTLDTFGRSRGGVIIMMPFIICWAIIAVSSTAFPILIARFLGGIAGGAGMVLSPIFISEVVEDSIRGALATGPVGFYCFGAFVSYLLGWFYSYHTVIWANLAFCVFTAVLLAVVAESPIYLLRQNREEDARASIAHYRGTSKDSKVVHEEISRLKLQISPPVEMISVNEPEQKIEDAEKQKLNDEEAAVEQSENRIPPWKQLFIAPTASRAFIIVGTTLSLQVCMGMVPVQVYAKDIFVRAAPKLSSHFCSVLLAIVLLGGAAVTASCADRAGRRVLIMGSSVSVAILLGTFAFFLQFSIEPAWMTAAAMLLYCFAFNSGSGTIPYVLIAEVFVPEVQSLASMILIEWVWFLNFSLLAVFPFMVKHMTIHGSFYLFAVFGVINAVFSWFMVPETKGLSIIQIQEVLLRRRK